MNKEQNDIAIRVENLSKCYQIYDTPRDRLKQFILPRVYHLTGQTSRQYFREFWALKDVSFEVKKGETIGIIGRNGSGKSTLLQLICGTLSPTSGSITTHGRIAALLELGSGFNPEFTGRENIYMNASVLGLSQEETDARFDDIAAFADIGEFIEQPVKTYSSGMMVRLGFAVQAQVEPDILIVDEALAVGDAKFQAKCFDRLHQLKDGGTSILLVTHSSEQIVTHCSEAILLDGGDVIEHGEPRCVVNHYMDLLFGKERKDYSASALSTESNSVEPTQDDNLSLNFIDDVFSSHANYNEHEYRWGDGTATILDFYLLADNEPYPSVITSGQSVVLGVAVRFYEDLVRPILGITIKTKEGVTVYGVNSETLETDEIKVLGSKGTTARIKAEFICRLAPGDYFISLGLATRKGEEIIPHDRRYDAIYLQIAPVTKFFGLVDLSFKLSVQNTSL
ncbi:MULTISPECIES: ABC transporter ATP-binding protein [Betaproteobacteria]|uniref:ABC transporter ATP-binding protein n=1 Tax=Betaproteobacteria TaxID=28216 RepID=UPI002CE55941|nr:MULTISPECIES: ABC transporter ATP-binding protein [Betaproteobacteria]HRN82728.1 ABC transporter ATP-binding protein [Nitrosomonas europaea]HRO22605.1 ABC transporter ATP-binding protein [Alcaligenes phenolicus]